MKVAIYCRVSDDKKKADGTKEQDVQRQVQMLNIHALKQGEEPMPYVDDGKSAFKEDWNSRPEFKRLVNDCRRFTIRKIYIEDMTRFSRRIDIGLPLLRELGELGVDLVSLKDGELEVTSSSGWMKSAILLMFAEWDSRIKSEKIRSGMEKAKAEGKRIGGRNPTYPAPLKSGKNKRGVREFPKNDEYEQELDDKDHYT